MLFDERIGELLDRKYEFVTKAPSDRFMLEAARYIEWLFTEDLVRPYALQLLDDDRQHRARFIQHRKTALPSVCELRAQVGRLYPDALKAEEESNDHGHEYRVSLTSFDRHAEQPRSVESEEEELERSPQHDPTTVGALLRILKSKEEALRGEDDSPEKLALFRAVSQQHELHEFRFNERCLRLLTSPARSMRNLLAKCRALNPPPDGVEDWMPFLARNDTRDIALNYLFKKDSDRAERMMEDARKDLERVHLELQALLGTSLSSVTLVSHFKERCTWFDKARMRALAAGNGDEKGVREDRLTMELARYLHDNGIFSLVRSRMANLEPDAIAPFGPRRLAIESKVHAKGESAKGAVRRGFWQLHAYLTSLETKTVHAHEGFLVVFRLGGGICDAPALVTLNRFRIHVLTIDLGDEESGHSQPRPSRIDVEELIEVAKLPEPPTDENDQPLNSTGLTR